MKDTWLKLHTSLLTSAKFLSLPGNDHRWAFVCLLILAKKRLEKIPERQLLGHINLSKRRWQTVRKDLIKSGLLGSNGIVIGFDDSQLTPSAIRKRNQRERDSHGNVTGNVTTDSRKQKADSREDKNKSATFSKMAPVSIENAERLCQVLGQGMVDNDPKARLPQTDKQKRAWVIDMEKINRLDERPWSEIEAVIVWCQQDDFWRSNILSPSKLRKQFPKLLLGMNRKPGKSKAQTRELHNLKLLEIIEGGLVDEGSSKIISSSS